MELEKILKYYSNLPELHKVIFQDIVNDLIEWIKNVLYIKNNFGCWIEKHQSFENTMVDFVKDMWLQNISWFFHYKKTDYTKNKSLNEIIDPKSNIDILWFTRRWIILKLLEYNCITDIWVNSDDLFAFHKEDKNLLTINHTNWNKEFDFDKFKIIDNENMLVFWKKEKLNKNNLFIYVMIRFFQEFKDFYWKNKINQDINLDNSYTKILFYNADKKALTDLKSKVDTWMNKAYIEKVEYKENWLYLNWEKVIMDKWMSKTFLNILCLYFSNNTWKISRCKFIDFFYENTNDKNSLNLKTSKNIKNGYMRTINKRIWKKYINNEILDMDWD